MPEVHVVKQGESLLSIASAHGFEQWQVIYEDDANAELRKLRPDPMTLLPGDSVTIPDKKPPSFVCDTRKSHSFQLRRPDQAFLRLRLVDMAGKPLAKARCSLTVDGKEMPESRSDGQGIFAQEIPRDAKQAELRVALGEGQPALEWTLEIGQLDPISEDSGVRARLANLGYSPGEQGPLTRALRAFQVDAGLPASGLLNELTRSRLAAVHP